MDMVKQNSNKIGNYNKEEVEEYRRKKEKALGIKIWSKKNGHE
jgi:hypothetical protein